MNQIKKVFSWLKKFISHHKKLSVVILIAIIVIGYIFFPKNKIVIATEKVMRGNLVKSISITGNIESQSSVNLTFQTGGMVNYLGAKEGDSVKKGQAIVSLDKQKLEASFRQAQQDFTAAKAASDQYYDNHKNATESYDEKIKRTALDATQNKAYDQMVKAQKDLTDSTLYSPINGILIKSGVESVGVNITPATVFTIVDPALLDFNMDIDEADIGLIRIGQPVQISLDSYPNEPFTLNISTIDFVTHTTSTGGDAYATKASLTDGNLQNKYRVGMNGDAEVILDRRYNVLSIPLSSIFDDNKVYIKTKSGYEEKAVKLGLQNDTSAEIISGLNEEDALVLDPTLVPQKQKSMIPF